MKAAKIVKTLAQVLTLNAAFLATFSSWAQEVGEEVQAPVPHSMVSLGDSITAGALGVYYRGYPISSSLLNPLLSLRLFQHTLAAIEFPKMSWSTGWDHKKDFWSHAKEIKRLFPGEKLLSLTAARSGDTSLEVLQKQIPALHKWSRTKLKGAMPDYVTLMVGPNDMCTDSAEKMRPVADYERNIRYVVDDLMKSSANTRVLIAAIPNIEKLREVARAAPLLVGAFGSCEMVWRLMRLCPTLTTISDPEERLKIANRVIEYNEALQNITENARAAYGDRVRFAKKPYETEFTADDLSIDCFHPNPIGQNLISQTSWVSSWWAKGN